MTVFHGLILGLIEGLSEFLPISSTAHLILAGEWLRLPSSEFFKTFTISIQLGAILAVVVLYWKKIWHSWELFGKIGAAFLPTALIGLIFYKIVKNYLLDNNYVIAGSLFVGGLVLIIFEKYYSRKQTAEILSAEEENNEKEKEDKGRGLEMNVSYKQAAGIGFFQALAIIPGVSRSAATIIGGLALGIGRKNIVEFSFLLAIPTMIAATGLDLYKSRATLGLLVGQDLTVWAIGFVMSFITAIISIRFFLNFIQKHNFTFFGWYRMALALIVMIWLRF
ncbi:TPA: undecaprenyl-diphosphatase [Candidatus Falkowbacteria bacterium]|nr:MAG: Undecaprenyl-diphosphatase [Candidatus Falkowbacteria bacterium GW2011_GWF2_43_32]HBA36357.1 undecaprenyl-diphosphatase [Candidatus Falkowbacteria bacterium]